jgi:copper homeostasis protein (lipoprotein)
MQTISKTFKTTLSCLALISMIGAHTPVFAESAEGQNHDSHHNAQNSLDWPGIYNGFLPCDVRIPSEITSVYGTHALRHCH